MSDILRQKRAYRRGLILGLTMAESVILIIFALLLALATYLIRKDQAIQDMTQQLDQLRQQIADASEDRLQCATAQAEARSLQKKMTAIQNLVPTSNDFDEMFKELVLVQRQAQRVTELEQQLAGLTELRQAVEKTLKRVETAPDADQSVAERLEQLVDKAVLWEQLANAFPQSDTKTALREMEQRLATLLELETAAKNLAPAVEPAQTVRTVTEQLQAADTQIDTLQGQMANLRRRCEAVGKGTEKPACWATPDGRPEYIFDVALQSGGVIVRDNALPHRTEEQRQLPLGAFGFSRELSLNQFRVAAQPLREWSHQHDCMFFVRIQDQTGPSQKAVYKQKLRTVGEFFYYYEPP